MRIGVEVEYWLVDDDGRLASGDDVAAACESVDREFVEPLVEVKTPPCDSVAELADALVDRLGRARDAARDRGKRLVPLGTPLSDVRVPRRTDVRTDVQRAVLGDDLAHAGHCAGALVTTAPYYRGRRVAACARPYAYRRLCYRRLPTHGRLWRYPESAFSPADAVWSPVRLRDDLGTVEWRAPDAAPPLDLCRLVADARRIVETAVERGTRIEGSGGDDCDGDDDPDDGAVTLPSFPTLRGHVDAAVARGVAAPRVERYLSELGVDPGAYRPRGVRLDGRERLDDGTARALRRRCADALDRELRRLRERGSDDDTPTAVPA